MKAKMEIRTALEDKTTSATWEDLGVPSKRERGTGFKRTVQHKKFYKTILEIIKTNYIYICL